MLLHRNLARWRGFRPAPLIDRYANAHLIDSAGNLVVAPAGYTITYQAIADPLTNTINTTTAPKTNFWSWVSYLFPALFPVPGSLAADVGIAGSPSFPRGTVIGCYSCHNGPNGG